MTISAQGATRILRIEGDGVVEINGITLTNGYSDSYGGAILNYADTLSLNSCMIRDSEAYMGGGVYSSGGKTTLANCTITNNTAEWGGGVFTKSEDEMTLTNCIITNNTAGYVGGAICNDYETTLSLRNCVISNNEAESDGGGVYSFNDETTLTNCTVTNNIAGRYGGAIYNLDVTLSLYNCTVAGNTAEYGGGVFLAVSTAVLNAHNSIIATNSASSSGADVFLSYKSAVANAYNTLSSYLTWTSGKNNLTYIKSRQLFTNAGSGDYTLAKNSQAINKGNNQYVTESVDLAGKTRIVGGTVDLGAYEYQSASSALFDEDAELFDEMEDSLDLLAASLLELR